MMRGMAGMARGWMDTFLAGKAGLSGRREEPAPRWMPRLQLPRLKRARKHNGGNKIAGGRGCALAFCAGGEADPGPHLSSIQ